jgi:hypothetical protein
MLDYNMPNFAKSGLHHSWYFKDSLNLVSIVSGIYREARECISKLNNITHLLKKQALAKRDKLSYGREYLGINKF